MMEGKVNILNVLSSAIREYLSMRTDDFRRNVIAGLSAGFSRVLAILVISLLLVIVLAVFAFGFIVVVGRNCQIIRIPSVTSDITSMDLSTTLLS